MTENRPRVLHTDAFPGRVIKEELEELKKINAEVIFSACTSEDDVIEAAKGAEGILSARSPLTRRVIETLKDCKVIARYGIGVDNVDVAAATDNNIVVANVPDFCFEEVSNHTIALLLACAKKLVFLGNSTRQGRWEHFPEPMGSIHGQTLGLVGCGNIGRTVAKKAQCLSLRVLGYDPYADKSVAKEHGITLTSLPELLKESDFVSVHTPLTKETRHIIGENELRLMKPSAYFINTARGTVVDEQALINALRGKWITGAGLDVFEKEPIDPDNPLLKMDNVVVTPHTASYSDVSFSLLRRRVGEAAANVLNGRWPRSVVNKDVKPKINLVGED
ncbi:C-terminal binding protein [Chloroflexota bacterium]